MMLRQKNKCATLEFHICCAQSANWVKVCGWIPDGVRGQWPTLIGIDAAEII